MSGSPPPSEQELQEEVLRLEAYRSQVGALLQQHQFLSASLADHRRARESLEGLEGIDAGTEFLIPVGGETYLRGGAEKGKPVLIGLGSGVVVEMSRPKASETLAQRIGSIERARQEVEGQVNQLEDRIQVLSQRLDSAAQGRGGGPDHVGGD
jgi:prefoldin alpha subunit